MSEYHNPYYNPEKLGLEMLSFDEPNLSYEYNTYIFVRTPDGRVFAAQDSGCSCPTPFENYQGRTMDEVIQKMERMEDYSMAQGYLRTWGRSWDGKHSWVDEGDIRSVERFFTN